MFDKTALLEREHIEILPSREALGLVNIEVNTVVLAPINLAFAFFGGTAPALQNVTGIAG